MVIKKAFYRRSTLKVARDLLGCFLVRKIGGKTIKAQITETEAYLGPNDLASHASRGRTERTEVMFWEGGVIYIYLVYGMYYMLNIVTEKENYPAAVLIRGAKLISSSIKGLDFEFNLNGPGKLTRALKIDKRFNGFPIYTKKHGLWVEQGEAIKKIFIKRGPRIGIDYAGPYKDKLWRFYLDDVI